MTRSTSRRSRYRSGRRGDGRAELFVRDADGRDLRRLEVDVLRGINTFVWDLLLDHELALMAEEAWLEEEVAAEEEVVADKKKRRRRKQKEESEVETPAKGERAKTPWAEAVRLARPLYVTPGSYTLVVRTEGSEAETELEIEMPEPRMPRMKKEPKIRGQKDD